MAEVLAVGVAVLDAVYGVEGFPREDQEVRARFRHLRRGGNAANTLAVLAQLGHRGSFAGVLAEGPEASIVVEDLRRHGIDLTHVRWEAEGQMPASCVLINLQNGSRTIVHHRDLPEFAFRDFDRIPLEGFHWVHFEGRHVEETRPMLAKVRGMGIPCSLEVEKPRPGIEALLPFPDLIVFSRAYVEGRGEAPLAFLRRMRAAAPQALLACPWGGEGAYGLEGARAIEVPPYPPDRVVDTLGAGDVFNAGLIDALLRGLPFPEALDRASRLAGKKCGQWGLEGLSPADG